MKRVAANKLRVAPEGPLEIQTILLRDRTTRDVRITTRDVRHAALRAVLSGFAASLLALGEERELLALYGATWELAHVDKFVAKVAALQSELKDALGATARVARKAAARAIAVAYKTGDKSALRQVASWIGVEEDALLAVMYGEFRLGTRAAYGPVEAGIQVVADLTNVSSTTIERGGKSLRASSRRDARGKKDPREDALWAELQDLWRLSIGRRAEEAHAWNVFAGDLAALDRREFEATLSRDEFNAYWRAIREEGRAWLASERQRLGNAPRLPRPRRAKASKKITASRSRKS